MDRRSFLKAAAGAGVATAITLTGTRPVAARTAAPGPSPYGPLLAPDANGIQLPAGFTSRVLATSEQPVPGLPYVWHRFPDGGATFPVDGGWVYVSNSEVPIIGGASALRFDASGEVVDAYRLLTGTSMNCAGGATPWGTWLSCEETPVGRVWECDPGRPGNGVVRPALGTFSHEAVAVDPDRKVLYLTEDAPDGGFYRFTPARYPDLTAGRLEAAAVDGRGAVTWVPVDPSVPATLQRSAGQSAFNGGEGAWYSAGHVYFTTKGDERIWDLDVVASELSVLYDAARHGQQAPLTGVDNVVMTSAGDLYVAEDGGNMELVVVTPHGAVSPVLRVTDQDGSEISGPAFDPNGGRLYFSSQRGGAAGITYEVRGPWRGASPAVAAARPAPASLSPAPTPLPAGELPATGWEAPAAAGLLLAASSALALRNRS